MEIIYKNPKDLKDYSNNPRNNAEAVEPVMDSIQQFGFLIPVIIDIKDEIVAGHTRKAAAIRLGMESVPCIRADRLTPEQIRAFRIVDNKTSEFATWDFDKLEQELNEILDVDLSAFKFPDLGADLQVSDADFLQDTEIVKERKPKTVKCPECGAEIKV